MRLLERKAPMVIEVTPPQVATGIQVPVKPQDGE